jgi:hypothetical protein
MVTGRIEHARPVAFPTQASCLGDLPVAGDHATGPLWVFLFWSPEWGRAIAVGDAPDPRDLVRRVLRMRARETGELDNVLDPHQSPVVFYRRCYWGDHPEGSLGVGFLQGMDRPRADWPPELRRALSQAERWLKRGAVKIQPFDYVDGTARIQRRDVGQAGCLVVDRERRAHLQRWLLVPVGASTRRPSVGLEQASPAT